MDKVGTDLAIAALFLAVGSLQHEAGMRLKVGAWINWAAGICWFVFAVLDVLGAVL